MFGPLLSDRRFLTGDQPDQECQYHGAEDSDEDGVDKAATTDKSQRAHDKPADEGANDTDDDIHDHAVATALHDFASDPASDQTDDDPPNDMQHKNPPSVMWQTHLQAQEPVFV